jgi:hypothetical protein
MNSAEFQPAPPSCRPLCDDPVDIGNGMVTFSDNSVGDMAIYTCDLGFELIGNATTTCALVDIDRAEFQPAPPFCRREHTKYPRITTGYFRFHSSILVACCALCNEVTSSFTSTPIFSD